MGAHTDHGTLFTDPHSAFRLVQRAYRVHLKRDGAVGAAPWALRYQRAAEKLGPWAVKEYEADMAKARRVEHAYGTSMEADHR